MALPLVIAGLLQGIILRLKIPHHSGVIYLVPIGPPRDGTFCSLELSVWKGQIRAAKEVR